MKSKYLFLSMPCALCLMPSIVMAGVRVGNLSRSYADSYGQVNGLRVGTVGGQNATVQNAGDYMPMAGPIADTYVTSTVDANGARIELPIRVANSSLAQKIGMGERVGNVGITTLENCGRIYPDGEFAWDTPTAGTGRGGAQTCVAVVEMHAVNADGRGTDAVLARANLAAGDNFKCNISDFPEYSYTEDAGRIEFPADREPTMDDVVAQMNQEQKQNAGLKIAAGAVIGALGGNIAGKAERGSDSILGTGKDKIQSSAIGALSGAAIMAGNSYAGKVGGDVILSAGVNAAAGGVMGNIMATGNSVLRIEECQTPNGRESCLWGTVAKTKTFTIGGTDNDAVKAAFYNIDTNESVQCKAEDDKAFTKCSMIDLRNIKLSDISKSIDQLKSDNNFSEIRYNSDLHYAYDRTTGAVKKGSASDGNGIWVRIASADETDGLPVRALVAGVHDKAMGYKATDWDKDKKDNKNLRLYGRDAQGNAYPFSAAEDFSLDNFRPMTIDASDGGIVDISNKARLNSTLTGAGIGGAMGGFVGYQGAQSDIDDRWVSAVREYKDSLTRVYCISGRRYLGQYNDVIVIPPLTDE